LYLKIIDHASPGELAGLMVTLLLYTGKTIFCMQDKERDRAGPLQEIML
jgi:hypothetical protein